MIIKVGDPANETNWEIVDAIRKLAADVASKKREGGKKEHTIRQMTYNNTKIKYWMA